MNGAKISIDPTKHTDEAKTKNSYEDNQPLLQGSHQLPSIFFASFQISKFSSFLFVSAKVVTILLKIWFCNLLYWIYMNLMSLVRIRINFFVFFYLVDVKLIQNTNLWWISNWWRILCVTLLLFDWCAFFALFVCKN